ncbi:hypothetical protein LB505_009562 [Fusarium chuoi]|nr:hypothetical protein LB505_009562 [Fusarium chuoi]
MSTLWENNKDEPVKTGGDVTGDSSDNTADNEVLEIVVFGTDFPSDSSSIKFRAVQWILTEILLALACIWNLLPRKTPNTNMYLYLLSNISSSILQVDFFRI